MVIPDSEIQERLNFISKFSVHIVLLQLNARQALKHRVLMFFVPFLCDVFNFQLKEIKKLDNMLLPVFGSAIIYGFVFKCLCEFKYCLENPMECTSNNIYTPKNNVL